VTFVTCLWGSLPAATAILGTVHSTLLPLTYILLPTCEQKLLAHPVFIVADL
jgi:hypothetical protein